MAEFSTANKQSYRGSSGYQGRIGYYYTNLFFPTHKITAPNKLNLYYLHKQGASQLFLGYCHVIEGECLCIGKAMSFVYSWLKPSVSHYHYYM